MSRLIRRIVSPLCFAALAAAALAIPASSGAVTTTACKISATKARSLGPTYVTYAEGRPGFRKRGTTCANGLKVIKAFHTCRLKHGKRGRCTTTVLGYSCTDRRPAAESIPTQFSGHVSCKRGSALIIHTYQQDL